MSDKAKMVKGYNDKGMASVLDGAYDLIKRAAGLLREINNTMTPPAVSQSYRREASMCLAEAEELISAVRAEHRL